MYLTVQCVARVASLATLTVSAAAGESYGYRVYQLAKDEARVYKFEPFVLDSVDGQTIDHLYEIVKYTASPRGVHYYDNEDYFTNSFYITVSSRGYCSEIDYCSSLFLEGDSIVFQIAAVSAIVRDKITLEEVSKYVIDMTFGIY